MIFEIAVGAFIALTVYDLVTELAREIAYRVNKSQRHKQVELLLESLQVAVKPVRKKAAAKPKPRKKAAAKRK